MHVIKDEGKKWNILGMKIIGKILSNETNGKYSVIVTETQPKGGPPMHIHTNEDELFYILKGNYEFYFGDKSIKAKQGDLIHLPKGIPHSFKNTDSILGITMNTITPGGFEGFFDDIANLSKRSKPTKLKIDSIASIYGVKFVKKKMNN
ncbi:hypothetical protein A8C32_15845 [Flavivirga aquatica]|uniref:Cupin type-2 domain-containing protein n=1 Tax=Flavivirga aquatica TaxID=1849968 RepID=A0A1E5T9R0_9FLAO|nr:hypothetical protein A8C32_15845 [Flavivirga aquatica]